MRNPVARVGPGGQGRAMTAPVPPLVEDLDALRRSLVAMVSTATEQDWDLPATGLEGTCWETTEQLAENLFA